MCYDRHILYFRIKSLADELVQRSTGSEWCCHAWDLGSAAAFGLPSPQIGKSWAHCRNKVLDLREDRAVQKKQLLVYSGEKGSIALLARRLGAATVAAAQDNAERDGGLKNKQTKKKEWKSNNREKTTLAVLTLIVWYSDICILKGCPLAAHPVFSGFLSSVSWWSRNRNRFPRDQLMINTWKGMGKSNSAAWLLFLNAAMKANPFLRVCEKQVPLA